jgi:hypothetical protein
VKGLRKKEKGLVVPAARRVVVCASVSCPCLWRGAVRPRCLLLSFSRRRCALLILHHSAVFVVAVVCARAPWSRQPGRDRWRHFAPGCHQSHPCVLRRQRRPLCVRDVQGLSRRVSLTPCISAVVRVPVHDSNCGRTRCCTHAGRARSSRQHKATNELCVDYATQGWFRLPGQVRQGSC